MSVMPGTIPLRPFPWLRPVAVKILIVADGSRISFHPGTGFSLSTVLDTLSHTPWWVRFDVTTAHRGTDPIAPPNLPGFGFAAPGVDLSAYDQIWLFGDDGPDLTAPELAALAQFMDHGGGVFAVGDHQDLGAGMGGGLLRVDSMRKWRYGGPAGDPPPALTPGRYDTLVRGHDGIYDFYDQSDDQPQRISIRPRFGWSPFPWVSASFPHPLLCGSAGPIDVLPDHMHEGEVVVPSDFSGNATYGSYTTPKWPGTARPEIIADATVTARTGADQPDYGAVTGKTFGVIGAYDGHIASVGRIAVDSTWHHWFDINLVGDPGDLAAPYFQPAEAQGFNATPAGRAALARVREYHRNVALWLSPKPKLDAMFDKAVHGLPWLAPVNELHPGEPIALLGRAAVDAIGRTANQCIIAEWIRYRLPESVAQVLRAFPPPNPNPPDPAPMRGLYLYREFALGGVVREVLTAFERSPKEPDPKELRAVVDRGLRTGFAELLAYERRAAQHVELLAEAFKEFTAAQVQPVKV